MGYSIRLIMVLSGSIVFLIWEIMNKLAGDRMRARWKRNLLLIPLFFYLFPLAYFKSYIVDFYHMLGVFQNWGRIQLEGKLNKTFSITFQNGTVILSNPMKMLIVLGIMGFCVSVFVLFFKVKNYRNMKKKIIRRVSQNMTDREQKILYQIKEEFNLKKNIRCVKTCKGESPFTMGIGKIIVAMPTGESLKESTWHSILRHELAHIKHGDMWWGAFAVVAMVVHWYNPLNYYYVYRLLCMNEEYADELAISKMDRQERVEYCNLLITLSEETSEISALKIGFGNNSGKNIKKRIRIIMKKNKNHMIIGMIICPFMILAGTLPVFAYKIPLEIENIKNDFSMEAEEKIIIGEVEVEKILYDDYCIDEFGREYPVNEENAVIACKHSYVPVIRQIHTKMGEGCKIDYYNAKRCSKCGRIVTQSLNNTSTWTKCPH